jgi:hypothetical protein
MFSRVLNGLLAVALLVTGVLLRRARLLGAIHASWANRLRLSRNRALNRARKNAVEIGNVRKEVERKTTRIVALTARAASVTAQYDARVEDLAAAHERSVTSLLAALEEERRLRRAEEVDRQAFYDATVVGTKEFYREHIRALSASLEDLLEPARTPGCVKVQLHTLAEAEEFARRIEKRVGLPPFAITTYKCDTCPRHPVTLGKIFHAKNRDANHSTAKRREPFLDEPPSPPRPTSLHLQNGGTT